MAIDIHTHIVPADLPPYLGSNPKTGWPSTCPAHCGHSHLMIHGKIFRTVSNACWNVEQRLTEMDRMGIEHQVLSPMPELLSYWFDTLDTVAMSRVVNDTIGGMVEASRMRFSGLGMVPLQDPDLAARELEALMADGRFRGVEIGTNVNGIPIGDPRFEPFFAAAERLGASVFVHALHPVGDERLIGPPILKPFVSFPCETSFAISSLISSGLLTRHPELKIAFSHGGGAFASVLPRLQFGWRKMAAISDLIPESPSEIARRLYYDTLVYDTPTLRFLLSSFGERSLLVGTDYPFEIYEQDPLGAIENASFSENVVELIRKGNALRYLSL
jgi:aminocarboxymuconate-semialdehyde decarboxylase